MKNNRWLWIGIFSCLLIAFIGYFWAARLVVIVLIDGLRYDTSMRFNIMPFLNSLRSVGASAKMHSQPPSFSEPDATTILTGAWPDINDGPAVDLDYAKIPVFTQDDIFSAAHRLGLRTAISGYYWFEKLIPQAAVDKSFYTFGDDTVADEDVMKAALKMVSDNNQLVLIHFGEVDYAGHEQGGPLDPRSYDAAKKVDDYLRQITSTLDLQLDTIIVLSDHGQIDHGGHGGPEPINLLEPFVMAGAGVHTGQLFPDIAQVDVAPTVAAVLGTNYPASFEGLVQAAMLNLSPNHEATIQSTETKQKKILLQTYAAAIKVQLANQADSANPFS